MKEELSFELPSGAAQILRTLAGAGYEAYLVGGCVRDLLRGVPPHDWISAPPPDRRKRRPVFPASASSKPA